jgi:methylthioribose-1-phosphate isomerase
MQRVTAEADVRLEDDIDPIRWQDDHLLLLDQTRLPSEQEWVHIYDAQGAAEAIKEMRVRGAPALGVTAAYAMALAAIGIDGSTMSRFLDELDPIAGKLAAARPTAVNLGWAVQRSLSLARSCLSPFEARKRLLEHAHKVKQQDIETNHAIGKHGAPLVPNSGGVLTHCNTGSLATAGFGTALGVIRAAWEQGKRPAVFCTETRPWLQGARLTAWELVKSGIPAELVVDSAAAWLMGRGEVQMVVVGADRIAANGDTANKIGTYSLAVLALEHGIPFYIAAPYTTVDLGIASGADIAIEERAEEEVTHHAGRRIAADGIGVRNPAFDVTPARYITGIITNLAVVPPPFERTLRAHAQDATAGAA